MSKIDIKMLEFSGFASTLRALRLPYGKDTRSCVVSNVSQNEVTKEFVYGSSIVIDEKDIQLMSNLVKAGDEHAKAIRGIIVYLEISAPIWFYREMETYRVGRERLGSESTMHIECKGLSGDELEDYKDSIPMGHIQRTADWYSYQTLRRIYFQRRNHRLPMWRTFCKFIESLPFAKELIICQPEKK